MKENSIEELRQKLEELYKTQQARLDVGADDLDIREEIAEVEEQIKELQDETSDEADIKEDIEIFEKIIKSYKEADKCGLSNNDFKNEIKALEHILSDYKRVLKENEELKSKNKTLEPVLIGNKMYFIDESLYEDLLNDIKNNYIPIQKLKDKIEELEQEIKDYIETDNTGRFRRDNCRLTDEVNILKELLEESEEKRKDNNE